LAGHPLVLLLDEPTLGLDPMNAERIQSFFVAPKDEGAVVFSTHDWREAETLATRVAVLNAGRLVAFESPAKMMADSGTSDLRGAVMKLVGKRGET
jgi:ABC-2 type transport system ATP-binding protein